MTKKSALMSLASLTLVVGLSGCSSTQDTDSDDTTNSPSASTKASKSPKPSPSKTKPSEAESKSSEPADQKPAVITISDFEFDTAASIAPGQTVEVTNEDQVLHTVTATGDGGFDVSIDGGATEEFTAPEEAGEFAFICTPHPYMKSTLVVE